ncbi:MAG TPA: tRNA glutamyl-Q(34) synthetase GluQRS [Methylotenera sp.]|nr:tRNA glutamyl-Q(34) synthetase GluQRS [Methylotenera sp.]HPH04341.1 tRNA glutamyl-Q(34) synthetase GluQRS [Methylotenera sp.]HPM99895.1 tRNA glutamyl-Q(34) synthetase GluQRS [Methylotenera sp.]
MSEHATTQFSQKINYIGRFAPSPTGPLHFGSLIAAVASYCDAKSQSGKWLVRMEDLDKPREIAGAADTILRQLAAFGFEWHDEVVYQSQRTALYENALEKLKQNGHIYPCICSRKEIADAATVSGIEGVIYPKTCYKKWLQTSASEISTAASRMDTGSQRIHVEDTQKISFLDAIQGNVSQHLATDVGDFILKRADGLFAYQLAVVVDDAAQGITHIVRGADLLASTPRQIFLQQLLGFQTPIYAHVPVAVNNAGEKLSKQTLAKPLDANFASLLIAEALQFLGQHPPSTLAQNSLAEIWQWAINNWQIANVPKVKMAHFASAC